MVESIKFNILFPLIPPRFRHQMIRRYRTCCSRDLAHWGPIWWRWNKGRTRQFYLRHYVRLTHRLRNLMLPSRMKEASILLPHDLLDKLNLCISTPPPASTLSYPHRLWTILNPLLPLSCYNIAPSTINQRFKLDRVSVSSNFIVVFGFCVLFILRIITTGNLLGICQLLSRQH